MLPYRSHFISFVHREPLIYGKSGRSGVCREHLIGVAWNLNKIMWILLMYGFTDIRVDPGVRRSIHDALRTTIKG